MTPLKLLLILASIAVISSAAVGIYVKSVLNEGLPSIQDLENPKQNIATQVLSADGEVLDHFFRERRIPLNYDSIPKDFINALIATEDRDFFNHWGVHTRRIINAAIKNILAGRTKEGASTITMQLARELFLNHENSFTRKIREAYSAMQIEETYPQEEILQMYSNTVIFGRGAYGIQVAAQVYFDKQPSELTTAECAFLVGLLKNPEKYNGRTNPDIAYGRRNLVLQLMFDQGYLNYDKYVKSLEEPFNFKTGKIKEERAYLAPHFVELVRQSLSNKSDIQGQDLYRDGLIIHTTINSTIQRYANEALNEHLSDFQKTFNKSWSWADNSELLASLITRAIRNRPEYRAADDLRKKSIELGLRREQNFLDSVKNAATTIQAALIVLNPKDGAILAMVGASPKFMHEHPDFKYSLNHATQIQRQAGSSFKPYVYAIALQSGMTPQSMVDCGPFSYTLNTGEVWAPRGTCKDGESPISLYNALRLSINTVAARLITIVKPDEINPSRVITLVRSLGIKSKLHAVPAIALGAGGEVTPLEMISAYTAFDNNGLYFEPYFYTKIEDHFGNNLYQQKEVKKVSDALPKSETHTLTRMLQAVVDAGTGSKVREYFTGIEAAGKTGTTNESADAWFIGYTPQLVAGIWVGFDDRRVTFDCIGREGY
ncbi:MAG: penicillin-binding protein, partial [Bacteroidota bacterium]|nr:penicillin-binding protein [Bacteroidota bacterium]